MSDNVKKEFSKNLNDLLYKNDMSRRDLASKLDVPYSTICNWCNGVTYPRMDKVELMARLFDVPKSRLVEKYDVVPDGYFFLDKDEQRIIEVYSHFGEEQKKRLLEYMEMWEFLSGREKK